MLIDWFTVGAQALNFLILVWLLRRFLYRPILAAIDARERRIAAALADAEAKETEAQRERQEFQHKNEELDRQRAALLSRAADEAKAERKRLMDAARTEADALSAKRQEALRIEADHLNQAIGHRTQQEVFAIARKALTDLATVSLEELMVDVFTRRLREMSEQAKAALAEAFRKASGPALVRSAFELPAQQRTMIQRAINQACSVDTQHLQFETAPELVSGVEVTMNGQKLAWSIADYLLSLEAAVDELLRSPGKSATEQESEAKAGTNHQ